MPEVRADNLNYPWRIACFAIKFIHLIRASASMAITALNRHSAVASL
jgi:hypothetical protein